MNSIFPRGCLNSIYLSILCGLFFTSPKNIKFVDANPDAPHRDASFENTAWTISDPDTFLPCIKLQGTILVQVSSAQDHVGTDVIPVPESAMANGHCQSMDRNYQDVTLTWKNFTDQNLLDAGYYNYTLNFGFVTDWQSEISTLNISSDQFALNSVTITYEAISNHSSSKAFPVSYSVTDFLEFSSPKNKSFACSTVNFRQGNLWLNISNFRVQAFNANEKYFEETFLCDADDLKRKSPLWYYVVEGMKWLFVGFFVICIISLILILLVETFNKRHDIVTIGYRTVVGGQL